MSQPKQVVFFVDRCLGKKQVPETLRSTGITVELHDDHFAKDAQDTDWLPQVGAKGWIVLTKDERIGKRTLEKIAVAQAGVKMFVLVSQSLSGVDMANAFKQAIKAIQTFVKDNPAPFIAKVYRDGRVEAWKDHEELLAEIDSTFNP
jgi:predicted nuclease of predicted toxin-antitoxin system